MLCFQIIQVYCEHFFRVIKGRFNSEDRWVRWLMFVLDSLDLFEPQSYIEMEDPQNAKNDKNGAFLSQQSGTSNTPELQGFCHCHFLFPHGTGQSRWICNPRLTCKHPPSRMQRVLMQRVGTFALGKVYICKVDIPTFLYTDPEPGKRPIVCSFTMVPRFSWYSTQDQVCNNSAN